MRTRVLLDQAGTPCWGSLKPWLALCSFHGQQTQQTQQPPAMWYNSGNGAKVPSTLPCRYVPPYVASWDTGEVRAQPVYNLVFRFYLSVCLCVCVSALDTCTKTTSLCYYASITVSTAEATELTYIVFLHGKEVLGIPTPCILARLSCARRLTKLMYCNGLH